jgi:creatinine amidohydrolase/Fe(II)-dependent formamide hydrolase-like protein
VAHQNQIVMEDTREAALERIFPSGKGKPGPAAEPARAAAGQADSGFAKLLAARGIPSAEIGTHAGLADTSLMLAIDPRLVRSERLQAGDRPAIAEGVYGDPRRASAELGQLGVDAIVAATVEAIRRDVARR